VRDIALALNRDDRILGVFMHLSLAGADGETAKPCTLKLGRARLSCSTSA